MIILKNRAEIEKIRTAGKYAMEMLLYLEEFIKEGMKTKELEALCEERLKKMHAVSPSFRGYNGYPYCLCVSVNDEVVHGMPGDYTIHEGDVVSIDFGAQYKGYHGDTARTTGVGRISDSTRKLLSTTEESLYKGVEQAREGNRLYDISFAVQSHVERESFSVVREFVGHGIGRDLHEEPQIPNYGIKNTGPRLKEGMVLAIEPMVNKGRKEVRIKENGWTAVTQDGSLSAHFEHTVAITQNGPEILTKV